ncbi:MAG: circadian clock KaiB family protein [Planctomycetes bacterium]|nr:circadian clock KaiB family protein [Planctomycetota bacterium]
MSKTPKAKPHAKKKPRGHYAFRLFLAGNGPNSHKALSNLRSLCREHLNGHCTIETIDVIRNFEAAARDNILITPALIMVTPGPRVVVLGNLNDREKVLLALRLSGGGES